MNPEAPLANSATRPPSGDGAVSIVNKAALSILSVAEDFVEKRQLDDLAASLKRLNRGIFRLVVMGEIKKGKSSFINALLGEPDLLPTSSDVATSTVFKLIYGPERVHKVFTLPDPDSGAVFPPKVIEREELVEYGTEDGNPGNEKRVDFIGIELPHPLLESGLVIVDTPGVGGLFKAHRDVTWRFAPNADAIIFVLDSVEAVISADEVSFLRDLTTKYTKRLCFVQTKIDNASEALWQGWRDRNKQILNTEIGIPESKLFYFPLSAKLKNFADGESDLEDLEDSGYPPLLHFINGKLIPAKESELARGVAAKLIAIAAKSCGELASQLIVAKESTASRLSEIEAERRRSVDEFNRWQHEQLQPALTEATKSLNRTKRNSLDRIDELLNPAGKMLLEFVEQQSPKSGAEIQEQVGVIQQDFMELCGVEIGKIFESYAAEFGKTCEQVSHALEIASAPYEFTKPSIDEMGVDYRQVKSLPMSASDAGQKMLYGGMFGLSLSTSVVTIAALAFPPLAALSVVAVAGGFLGAANAHRTSGQRRKEEAISKLRSLLSEQLSQIRRTVIRYFEDKADECSASLQETVNSATVQTKQDLDRRLQEARAAGSRTKEDAKALVEDLDRKLSQGNSLVKNLSAKFELSRA